MKHETITAHFVHRFATLMKLARPRRFGSYTRGEMRILSYLYDRNTPAIPGELSATMDASSARVAAALRSLEAKGQIERSIDGTDRRRVLVSITDNGQHLVAERRRELYDYCAEVISRLGEEDTRESIRILDRIIDIAQDMEMQNNADYASKEGDSHGNRSI